MLRQLARLGRRLPAAGPRALAVAVYASADDELLAAADQGFEGVACVDDGARALVLYCDLWLRTGEPWARDWATGLLDFVLWMQEADGSFVNFIVDWSGRKNRDGTTSRPGPPSFWQARAVRGLARASIVLEERRAADGFRRGLQHLRGHAPSDQRATHALGLIDLLRVGRGADLRPLLASWCDEITSVRRGGVLLNHESESEPHLWGHLQEGVLAEAASILGRPGLLAIARRSADEFLRPIVLSSFDRPTVLPYEVACVIYDFERLAAATGDAAYAELAERARAWFHGRNSARAPVYDAARGRVADGIDDGRVSQNSGAEANIVGAQALIEEVVARRWDQRDVLTAARYVTERAASD